MSLRQLYCFQLILAQNVHAALPQSNIVETDALTQWCQAMLCVEALSIFSWSPLQPPGPHCNPLATVANSLVPIAIP